MRGLSTQLSLYIFTYLSFPTYLDAALSIPAANTYINATSSILPRLTSPAAYTPPSNSAVISASTNEHYKFYIDLDAGSVGESTES